MATLYYGSGDCTIEGTEIRGVQINYRGRLEINKTANNNFALIEGNNKIIIFPVGEGYLNNLFKYRGEFKVLSVTVAGKSGERIQTSIKRVMDYSELLESNAEDLTVKAEDISAGHISGGTVSKPRLLRKTIDNLNSANMNLFLKDGTPYSGSFHIHIENAMAMSGATHSKDSQELYIKKIETGKLASTKFTPVERKTTTRRSATGKAPTTQKTSGGGY